MTPKLEIDPVEAIKISSEKNLFVAKLAKVLSLLMVVSSLYKLEIEKIKP